MKTRRENSGQGTLEFLLVLAAILVGLLSTIGGPLSRGIQSLFRDSAETITSASSQMAHQFIPPSDEQEEHEQEGLSNPEDQEPEPLIVASGPTPSTASTGSLGSGLPGFGGGGGIGGSATGGGSGGSVTGSDTPTPTTSGTETTFVAIATPVLPFAFMPRGENIWTDWPPANRLNIQGSIGTSMLKQTFDIVAGLNPFNSIANDILMTGIPLLFGEAENFPCGDAIACFTAQTPWTFPSAPIPPPPILFNPEFVNEEPALLAAVLIHEGTHFQQFLEGELFTADLKLIPDNANIEFRAWVNAAVYWDRVRSSYAPYNTPLELEAEHAYQVALLGEGPFRDFLTSLYG